MYIHMKSTICFLKRIVFAIVISVMAGVGSADAQTRWNQTFQNYIDEFKDVAIEQMLRHHIPASITLAQGLLESGAGRSELAVKGNNHFGIKCHGWEGRKTYHDDDLEGECFRAYDNALQSYEDHSKFLRSGRRYRSLFSLEITDYKGWAHGLKAAGYATNPAYAHRLIDIIETYKLYQYDTATKYDRFMVEHTPHHGNTSNLEAGYHPIRRANHNYYLIARKGDTFKSIAEEVDISARKLAKYNERKKRDILSEGDIVYLKKKRTKADKTFKHKPHVVQKGESMYDIAQNYGIRLKSLYKKNHLDPHHYTPRVGDILVVY